MAYSSSSIVVVVVVVVIDLRCKNTRDLKIK